MKQYSILFTKDYIGDADTSAQLNRFLEEHPNYIVDTVSFENPIGTCVERLFVVFRIEED